MEEQVERIGLRCEHVCGYVFHLSCIMLIISPASSSFSFGNLWSGDFIKTRGAANTSPSFSPGGLHTRRFTDDDDAAARRPQRRSFQKLYKFIITNFMRRGSDVWHSNGLPLSMYIGLNMNLMCNVRVVSARDEYL